MPRKSGKSSSYEGNPRSTRKQFHNPVNDFTGEDLITKKFKARNQKQLEVLEAIEQNSLIFLVGPAGTAKTFLAAYAAISRLKEGSADTILAARPAVEAGDSLGYLKGDLLEKMGPYIRPVIDNLEYWVGKSAVQTMQDNGVIEITSMTYLRGRNFSKATMILDEMQNATSEQLKLALTRAGEDTTIIVTMDPDQIDLPNSETSAVHDLELFVGLKNIAIIRFDVSHVERSELVSTVLKAYAKKR